MGTPVTEDDAIERALEGDDMTALRGAASFVLLNIVPHLEHAGCRHANVPLMKRLLTEALERTHKP